MKGAGSGLASRVKSLNACPVNKNGSYVLYWVQASPRPAFNHALEYAIDRANSHDLPLIACFGLADHFPNANRRHYRFLLEGLVDFQECLKAERGVEFRLGRCSAPPQLITGLAGQAAEVVVDMGYLRIQRAWYAQVADDIDCLLSQVETNVVVPVELASDKEEFAARTIRPKIWAHATDYLHEPPGSELKSGLENAKVDWPKIPNVEWMDLTSDSLNDLIDTIDLKKEDLVVTPIDEYRGGHSPAVEVLEDFLSNKLSGYDAKRNFPGEEFQSYMSPYLHYGHISPIEIMLAVQKTKAPKKDKDAYVEELLVRRELSMNFVWFNPDNYDSLKCLPDWAKITIEAHRKDKRDYLYSLAEWEAGETHDQYWNAAQLEMVHTGKMHGYMRMYWGKKVIEWSPDAETAYNTLIYLNDKYELDGRDPNGFTGVGWCFGKHDRAHAERPVFGKLRYMNDEGLRRKFKGTMDEYVRRMYGLAGRKLGDVKKRGRSVSPEKSKKSPVKKRRKGRAPSPSSDLD